MKTYLKAIISILGGVSTWGITAAADNAITQVELFGLLGVLSTALAVYAFPNAPAEGEEPAGDGGHVDLVGLLVLAVGLIVVLVILRAFSLI